nr:replication protein A 70 kDa DNA-binding subunit B [Tanacetum cinerariifolium]
MDGLILDAKDVVQRPSSLILLNQNICSVIIHDVWYKVIVRVIDQTGSASLLLYDDIISKLVGVSCYKLKEQYGANAENTFPEELTNNIFDLHLQDKDDVLETPAPSVGTRHSKLQYQDSLPFNLEVTPPSTKGKEVASSASDEDDVLETPVPSVGKEVASSTSVEDRNGDHQSDIFRTLHISSSTT